jgi:uncharacterized membrane protein YhhN
MKIPQSLIPFVLFSILHLAGHAAGIEMLHMGTKPFLMPTLGFYFWKVCIKTPLNKFVYAALIFSWLGDSLLIFSDYNGLFFIAGLIAFLIAHIVYIIMNLNFVNDGNSKLVFKWPALFFIAYGILVFSQLVENLGLLTLPVAIYTSVICIMGITAYGRIGRTSNADYRLVIGGAISFIISDSLLAFNKFGAPIGNAGFWVMITYLGGQLLLVQGYMRFINGLKAD